MLTALNRLNAITQYNLDEDSIFALSSNNNLYFTDFDSIIVIAFNDEALEYTLDVHKSKITHLVSDGNYLISISTDYTIKIWQLDNENLIFECNVKNYTKIINVVCLCVEQNALYIGGKSCIVKWKYDDKILKAFDIPNSEDVLVETLAYIPAFKAIASGSMGGIVVFDEEENNIIYQHDDLEAGVVKILALHSSKLLISMSDFSLQVLDFITGEKSIINAHTDQISDMVLINDKKHLITISLDKSLKVWCLEKNVCIKEVFFNTELYQIISASPNNAIILDNKFNIIKCDINYLTKAEAKKITPNKSSLFQPPTQNYSEIENNNINIQESCQFKKFSLSN